VVVGKYEYVKKTDNIDYENNDVGEVNSSVSCVCVCVCARARARACVRACVHCEVF